MASRVNKQQELAPAPNKPVRGPAQPPKPKENYLTPEEINDLRVFMYLIRKPSICLMMIRVVQSIPMKSRKSSKTQVLMQETNSFTKWYRIWKSKFIWQVVSEVQLTLIHSWILSPIDWETTKPEKEPLNYSKSMILKILGANFEYYQIYRLCQFEACCQGIR